MAVERLITWRGETRRGSAAGRCAVEGVSAILRSMLRIGSHLSIAVLLLPGLVSAQSIDDLGHADYAVRQRATDRLIEAGRASASLLLDGLAHSDAEVRLRCREILLDPRLPLAAQDLRSDRRLLEDRVRALLTLLETTPHGARPGLMAIGEEGIPLVRKQEPDDEVETRNALRLLRIRSGLPLGLEWERWATPLGLRCDPWGIDIDPELYFDGVHAVRPRWHG